MVYRSASAFVSRRTVRPVLTLDAHRRGHRGRRRQSTRTRPKTRDIELNTVARSYFRDISDLVDLLFVDIDEQIVSQIERWVAEEDRTNDTVEDELPDIIAELTRKYSSARFLLQYQTEAAKTSEQSSLVHREQTKTQLRSLGIAVFNESPRLSQLLRRFTVRNTRLITSIPIESLGKVASVVESGISDGLRAEEISRQILATTTPEGTPSSELEKAKNRSALIARDQVSRIGGELSRSRQRSNGITRFIWRTVGDARVRDLHEPREGKEYSWEEGAGENDPFPGSGISCRCSAEPVL